jgi:hypothetical protein
VGVVGVVALALIRVVVVRACVSEG